MYDNNKNTVFKKLDIIWRQIFAQNTMISHVFYHLFCFCLDFTRASVMVGVDG